MDVIFFSIFQVRNPCSDCWGNIHSHKANWRSKAKFTWSHNFCFLPLHRTTLFLTCFSHHDRQPPLCFQVRNAGATRIRMVLTVHAGGKKNPRRIPTLPSGSRSGCVHSYLPLTVWWEGGDSGEFLSSSFFKQKYKRKNKSTSIDLLFDSWNPWGVQYHTDSVSQDLSKKLTGTMPPLPWHELPFSRQPWLC